VATIEGTLTVKEDWPSLSRNEDFSPTKWKMSAYYTSPGRTSVLKDLVMVLKDTDGNELARIEDGLPNLDSAKDYEATITPTGKDLDSILLSVEVVDEDDKLHISAIEFCGPDLPPPQPA